MKVSENTSISMPARNLISIIAAVTVGAWFAFGVIERLNSIETQLQLIEKDIELLAKKYPQGMSERNTNEIMNEIFTLTNNRGYSDTEKQLVVQEYLRALNKTGTTPTKKDVKTYSSF